MCEYIEPGDPRWYDPFSRYSQTIVYEWVCIKNGNVVKTGTRVIRVMYQKTALELVAKWNAPQQNPTYKWEYKIIGG